MKILRITLLAMMTILCSSACSSQKTTKDMEKKKVLVVYFSATGTTEKVAQRLARVAEADICEITPVLPYSRDDLDWTNPKSRSSVEMNDPESRPEVKPIDVDIRQYDCIFLGYPIWWDLAPRAVNTFIESNDMTGKTVIPFATSGGSGISGSVAAMKRAYPAVKWQDGKLLNGAKEKSLKAWLETIE